MSLPDGNYAYVELVGREWLVGRVSETTLLGKPALQVEIVFRDTLMPPVIHPDHRVYRVTDLTRDQAFEMQAPTILMVPAVIEVLMPPELRDQALEAARAHRLRRLETARHPAKAEPAVKTEETF